MMITDKAESRFFKDFFVLTFLFVSGFLIGQIISAVILYAYYGQDIINLKEILTDSADHLNTIRIAQLFSSFVTFGISALLFSVYKIKHPYNYGLQKQPVKRVLWLIAPLLILTIYPFLNLTYILNKESFLGNIMPEQQEQYAMLVEALLRPTSFFFFLFNLIIIAVFPAVLEEYFFRGTLQRLFLERMNVHIAVLLTSVIFSLIHFEFSAFLPRIILGILLGYIFYLSGNIWLSVFTHLFNNGLEVTQMYLKNLHLIAGKPFDAPTMPTIPELTGYSILFIILSIFFYRFSKR